MTTLLDFLKFLAKEYINVEFDMKTKENYHRVGNFVKIKNNSLIFRPAGGPMNPDAYFTFKGKGPQDTEIRLDDINMSSLSFTILDNEQTITFAAVERNLKQETPLLRKINIFRKTK